MACKTGADKRALVRFVRVDLRQLSESETSKNSATNSLRENMTQVYLDPSGRKPGRGAYLCAREECYEKARKTKALERALRCSIPTVEYEQLSSEFAKRCAEEHNRAGTVENG